MTLKVNDDNMEDVCDFCAATEQVGESRGWMYLWLAKSVTSRPAESFDVCPACVKAFSVWKESRCRHQD